MAFGEKEEEDQANSRLDKVWQSLNPDRISLYCNYFARQNRFPSEQTKSLNPPKYLLVVETTSAIDVASLDKGDLEVSQFELIQSFGDKIWLYE